MRLRNLRRPSLEAAAHEARAGFPLALVAALHGVDEGAVLAAAGLTFEGQRRRERLRADLAFASSEPLSARVLDSAVARRMGDR
jgi:hypothetical protein